MNDGATPASQADLRCGGGRNYDQTEEKDNKNFVPL